MSPILVVDDVSYAYPDGRRALNHVSFTVDQGERVAVLGPNGAGKTTLAMHLNGTLLPNAGSLTVDATLLETESLREIRKKVGLVFQDSDDQLFMSTVMDDVKFGPQNLGLDEAECVRRAEDALRNVEALDLAERAPHHLSGGERRRVALATTLAMRPSLIVFDEPTSDLDPATRYELGELLTTLPTAQIVVTHDLAFAEQVCERSLIVDSGSLVFDGLTSDVLADSALLAQHRLGPPV